MEIKKQILAVIQARMNSTRLPGKVLKKIGNLTCIEILLKRLSKSKLIDQIMVVTSTNQHDDILYDKLSKIGVDCFRGEETNVYKRFLDALKNSGIELDRFYVYKICSPSRSSIQTGRNPIHVNVQNVPPEVTNSKDIIGGYQGIPTNMTGIAALLRKQNYKMWHNIQSEDVSIIEGMQKGRNSPIYNGGNFSPIMDQPTHQFHKWVANNLL